MKNLIHRFLSFLTRKPSIKDMVVYQDALYALYSDGTIKKANQRMSSNTKWKGVLGSNGYYHPPSIWPWMVGFILFAPPFATLLGLGIIIGILKLLGA